MSQVAEAPQRLCASGEAGGVGPGGASSFCWHHGGIFRAFAGHAHDKYLRCNWWYCRPFCLPSRSCSRACRVTVPSGPTKVRSTHTYIIMYVSSELLKMACDYSLVSGPLHLALATDLMQALFGYGDLLCDLNRPYEAVQFGRRTKVCAPVSHHFVDGWDVGIARMAP